MNGIEQITKKVSDFFKSISNFFKEKMDLAVMIVEAENKRKESIQNHLKQKQKSYKINNEI